MDIEGKIAIVTGAAAGIGLATVRSLIERGASGVIAADVDSQRLESEFGATESKENSRVETACVDVSDEEQIKSMFKACLARFGRVDIVVNNAGIVTGSKFPEVSIERLRRMVETNLLSIMVSTVLACEHMKSGGAIVNLASTASFNPNLVNAPYSTTKAGVNMFTQSCKDLFETRNIRVNAVCPGITNTEILAKSGGGSEVPPWLASAMEGKRIWEPSDIADAIIGVIQDDAMHGDYRILRNSELEHDA